MSKRYTPLPPWRGQSLYELSRSKVAFGTGAVNVTKVLPFRDFQIQPHLVFHNGTLYFHNKKGLILLVQLSVIGKIDTQHKSNYPLFLMFASFY